MTRKKYSKAFKSIDEGLESGETADLIYELVDEFIEGNSESVDYRVRAVVQRNKEEQFKSAVGSRCTVEGKGVYAPDGNVRVDYMIDHGKPFIYSEEGSLDRTAIPLWVNVRISADTQETFDKISGGLTGVLERQELARLEEAMGSCCSAMIEQMNITDRYKELKGKYGKP